LKISISFYTLRDLSDLAKGEKLLDILSTYGLIIEKAGEYEPIRKDFDPNALPKMWQGKGAKPLDCTFIFKGKKEISFSGMASWELNINPKREYVNVVGMWLNIPPKYDIDRLIRLGDDLFIWSEAIYGYITEKSKNLSHTEIQKDGFTVSLGNVYRGISGLMWANYFGTPYLREKDFCLPDDHETVGHGARIILTDTPDDERLSDLNFRKVITDKIGADWFFQFEKIENGVGVLPKDRPQIEKRENDEGFLLVDCRQDKRTDATNFLSKEYKHRVARVPVFDNSEISAKS